MNKKQIKDEEGDEQDAAELFDLPKPDDTQQDEQAKGAGDIEGWTKESDASGDESDQERGLKAEFPFGSLPDDKCCKTQEYAQDGWHEDEYGGETTGRDPLEDRGGDMESYFCVGGKSGPGVGVKEGEGTVILESLCIAPVFPFIDMEGKVVVV